MKVRLQDIAEDTGYSISTVSRVLNGLNANYQTKKEIFESAKKLNYPVQNILADTDTNEMLDVLLVSGLQIGEFYASFFDGLNKAASREKVRLSVLSLEDEIPKTETIVEKIEEEQVDGIILNLPRFKKTHYRQLKEALPEDFPIVSKEILNRQVFPTVGFDNYGGGYQVAEHFKSRKYKKCGIIYGPSDKNSARQRAHGYNDFITNDPDLELVWESEGNFSFKSGSDAFEKFHNASNKPRAIFASNDNMCQGFMQEAMVKGYSFPDDIAIVGFDDLPICKRHQPQISSINTNYEDLGMVSIQRMKELLEHKYKPKSVLNLVGTTLIKRASS